MSISRSSHPQSEESLPLRSALPSRSSTREDVEVAQSLISHAQGARDTLLEIEQNRALSGMRNGYTGATTEVVQQRKSWPSPENRDDRKASQSQHEPSLEAGSEGQICRYVHIH